MLLVFEPPVGGGTYHLDRRVFPCRFWSRKKRIILAERIYINIYMKRQFSLILLLILSLSKLIIRCVERKRNKS